jgi:hypothetical protein
VEHSDQAERRYTVTTLTEEEFLRERVWPYFERLQLSPVPATLAEFRQLALPESSGLSALIGSARAAEDVSRGLYDKLLLLHQKLHRYESWLTGEMLQVSLDEVAIWTTYPSRLEPSADWRCLAVRSAKLQTQIPIPEFRQVRLYDTPGLGGLRAGEVEALARSIDAEADAVLRIERPDPVRVRSEQFMSELNDRIESQLQSGIRLRDLQSIVLNRLADGSNSEMCKVEYDLAVGVRAKLGRVVIADCSNADELQRFVLVPLLEYLVSACPEQDAKRLRMLDERVVQASNQVLALMQTCRESVSIQLAGYDSEEDFLEWFKEVQGDFAGKMCELRERTLQQRTQQDSDFLSQLKTVTQKAHSMVTVPEADEIRALQVHSRSIEFGGTIDHFTTRLRAELGAIYSELRGELGRKVIEATQLSLLQAMSSAGLQVLPIGAAPGEAFAELARQFDSGKCPQLAASCRMIAEFCIDFPHFLSAVWGGLSLLHPDNLLSEVGRVSEPDPKNPVRPAVPLAACKKLSEVLAREKQRVIRQIEQELSQIAAMPSNLCWGLVWEIHDRLVHRASAESEWRRFLRERRQVLMPERSAAERESLLSLRRLSNVLEQMKTGAFTPWGSQT